MVRMAAKGPGGRRFDGRRRTASVIGYGAWILCRRGGEPVRLISRSRVRPAGAAILNRTVARADAFATCLQDWHGICTAKIWGGFARCGPCEVCGQNQCAGA